MIEIKVRKWEGKVEEGINPQQRQRPWRERAKARPTPSSWIKFIFFFSFYGCWHVQQELVSLFLGLFLAAGNGEQRFWAGQFGCGLKVSLAAGLQLRLLTLFHTPVSSLSQASFLTCLFPCRSLLFLPRKRGILRSRRRRTHYSGEKEAKKVKVSSQQALKGTQSRTAFGWVTPFRVLPLSLSCFSSFESSLLWEPVAYCGARWEF